MKNALRSQQPFQRSTGTIVQINLSLLMVPVCAWLSWACWPSTPEWWGMGIYSIIFALAACVSLIRAIRLIIRLHMRDRALAAYQKQGQAPKEARLADHDHLKQAGMIDG